MIKEQDIYKIGVIGKAHGVKGELSIQIDDDIFDRVDAEYLVLKLDGIFVPFSWRSIVSRVIVLSW